MSHISGCSHIQVILTFPHMNVPTFTVPITENRLENKANMSAVLKVAAAAKRRDNWPSHDQRKGPPRMG